MSTNPDLPAMARAETISLDLATIRRLVEQVVSDDSRVLAVYLFGSRARGEALEGSDLDLAVLLTEPFDVMELLALEDRLERPSVCRPT